MGRSVLTRLSSSYKYFQMWRHWLYWVGHDHLSKLTNDQIAPAYNRTWVWRISSRYRWSASVPLWRTTRSYIHPSWLPPRPFLSRLHSSRFQQCHSPPRLSIQSRQYLDISAKTGRKPILPQKTWSMLQLYRNWQWFLDNGIPVFRMYCLLNRRPLPCNLYVWFVLIGTWPCSGTGVQYL